jgi:hypothetical protein
MEGVFAFLLLFLAILVLCWLFFRQKPKPTRPQDLTPAAPGRRPKKANRRPPTPEERAAERERRECEREQDWLDQIDERRRETFDKYLVTFGDDRTPRFSTR